MKTKMTPKKNKFVLEYLKDNNATQAAIRSGYSNKTAYSQGQRLLKNVEIKAAIDLELSKQAKRTGINADYVLNSLKEIADRCMQKVMVMEMGLPTGEWKFDAGGATKALELLGKHLKLFTDKTDDSLSTFINSLSGDYVKNKQT
jgi:phage terminase small subunit